MYLYPVPMPVILHVWLLLIPLCPLAIPYFLSCLFVYLLPLRVSISLHACVHILICTYIPTYVCSRICILIFVCISSYVPTYIPISLYLHVYVPIYLNICPRINLCVPMPTLLLVPMSTSTSQLALARIIPLILPPYIYMPTPVLLCVPSNRSYLYLLLASLSVHTLARIPVCLHRCYPFPNVHLPSYARAYICAIFFSVCIYTPYLLLLVCLRGYTSSIPVSLPLLISTSSAVSTFIYISIYMSYCLPSAPLIAATL